MTFAKNLKYIRQKHNLTQEDLANHLNVSRKTVSSWETSRTEPDFKTIQIMSKTFNVPIQDFLDDSVSISGSKKYIKKFRYSKNIQGLLMLSHFLLIIFQYVELFEITDLKFSSILLIISTILLNEVFNISFLKTETNLRLVIIFVFNIIICCTSILLSHSLISHSSSMIVGITIGKLITASILSYAQYTFIKVLNISRCN